MKKKKTLVLLSVAATAIAATAATFVASNAESLGIGHAGASTTRTFDINCGVNWFGKDLSESSPASGTYEAKTYLGNIVKLQYSKALKQTEHAGWFATGGYVMNTTPIGTINSLTVVGAYKSSFVIEYGWTLASDNLPYFEEYINTGFFEKPEGESKTYYFDGECPNYIKLTMYSTYFGPNDHDGRRGFASISINYNQKCPASSRTEPYANYKKSAKTVSMEGSGYRNIVRDEKFRKGFKVTRKDTQTSTGPEENGGYFNNPLKLTQDSQWKKAPTQEWQMTQWMSKHLFNPDETLNKDDGTYINNYSTWSGTTYTVCDRTKKGQSVGYDAAKKFTYDISNSKGKFTLNCNTGQEYQKNWENEWSYSHNQKWWVHFLLEQDFAEKSLGAKVSSVSEIVPYAEYTMDTIAGDGNTKTANNAQLDFYLKVQNLNKEKTTEYGKYFWFGFTLFERSGSSNKKTYDEYCAAEAGTDAGIYKPASSNVVSTGLPTSTGVKKTVDCGNIKTLIATGLSEVQAKGFMANTTIDDLYVAGFNLGFESQGMYETQVSFENFGIYVK